MTALELSAITFTVITLIVISFKNINCCIPLLAALITTAIVGCGIFLLFLFYKLLGFE